MNIYIYMKRKREYNFLKRHITSIWVILMLRFDLFSNHN